MFFTIPSSLPYAYNALEPHIDAKTMELHHTKHHQAYVDNLNQALAGKTDLAAQETEALLLNDLLQTISNYDMVVRNNAGGHFNHLLFWDILSPNAPKQCGAHLSQALDTAFGSFSMFKKTFTQIALSRFGSGWAWLSVAKKNGQLILSSTANQDNPLMNTIDMEERGIPILGLDVWEHAYYLLYQNRRLAYIESFWEIINWKAVENRFLTAKRTL